MGTRTCARNWAAVIGTAVLALPAAAQSQPSPAGTGPRAIPLPVSPLAPAVVALVGPPAEAPPPTLVVVRGPSSARISVADPVTVPPTAAVAAPANSAAAAVRVSGEAAAAAAVASLRHAFDRLTVPAEPRRLAWLPVSATLPPAPVPAPPPQVPPTPTVIVVREPVPAPAVATPAPPAPALAVEYRPVPVPAPALSPALAAALGVSAAGFVMTVLLWVRLGRPAPAAVPAPPVVVYASAPGADRLPPQPPAPPVGEPVLPGLDFGPPSETAERFEIGPTYQEQLRMQKEAEERGRDEMARRVLEANLVLLTAADDEPAAG